LKAFLLSEWTAYPEKATSITEDSKKRKNRIPKITNKKAASM
jgi:hypothetical protein